jgi:hypothetical protein
LSNPFEEKPMSNTTFPFGCATPANGPGGGGGHAFIVERPPIPEWALAVLADPQLRSEDQAITKSALRDYLTRVDIASLQYQEAINAAEIAYSRAIDEASFEIREKLLGR